jgi:hypothetical protein
LIGYADSAVRTVANGATPIATTNQQPISSLTTTFLNGTDLQNRGKSQDGGYWQWTGVSPNFAFTK